MKDILENILSLGKIKFSDMEGLEHNMKDIISLMDTITQFDIKHSNGIDSATDALSLRKDRINESVSEQSLKKHFTVPKVI